MSDHNHNDECLELLDAMEMVLRSAITKRLNQSKPTSLRHNLPSRCNTESLIP